MPEDTKELHRDVFGATGVQNGDEGFKEYSSKKEAAKVKSESAGRGERVTFKQAEPDDDEEAEGAGSGSAQAEKTAPGGAKDTGTTGNTASASK